MKSNGFEFKNLTSVSKQTVVDVFNHCFADYLIPLQLTMEEFNKKLKSENIQLHRSMGVFHNDQLIAFILIAIDGDEAYNAGTGVLPTWRGFNFTVQMYRNLLPLLFREGISRHKLEVLIRNSVAFNAYKKTGFQISRKVAGYMGTLDVKTELHDPIIESISCLPTVDENDFFNSPPTYQNSLSTIHRMKENLVFKVIKNNNEIIAWLIYEPQNMRIKSFAVKKDHRNKGYGRALFSMLKTGDQNKAVSVINIDTMDTTTCAFLKKIGLSPYIYQYELTYQYEN